MSDDPTVLIVVFFMVRVAGAFVFGLLSHLEELIRRLRSQIHLQRVARKIQ